MAALVQQVLAAIPVWAVYLAVFLLPFLEASIFLGFLIPGETALVFGGVLAGNGHADVVLVLAIGIAGAVFGDSIGYLIGRRYGTALQLSRLGQLVGAARWQVAEQFVQRRGGPAVFFGRFAALLRALVPGVAGMARLHYRTFVIWNLLGGATWASACVLGGWAIGDVISTYLSDAGYVLAGAVAVAVVIYLAHRKRSARASQP